MVVVYFTEMLRAFTRRRDTPFTCNRCGTNHVQDNLTPETECMAVAVLMRVRASNIILVQYRRKRMGRREGAVTFSFQQ